MPLQVCILTPDRIFQNDESDELILQTNTGQIGVLCGHAPLITVLDIGMMLSRQQSNWKPLVLIGGFALVQDNKVTILVNEAISASILERKEVEETLEKATNRLTQVVDEKEKVEATFSFKRARARYQVIQWKGLAFFKIVF